VPCSHAITMHSPPLVPRLVLQSSTTAVLLFPSQPLPLTDLSTILHSTHPPFSRRQAEMTWRTLAEQFVCPGWLLHGLFLHRCLLAHRHLLTCQPVVALPLVAPPSCFSRLVVVSPLVAPPLHVNAPAANSHASTFHSSLARPNWLSCCLLPLLCPSPAWTLS
jgi:hypothetical protein